MQKKVGFFLQGTGAFLRLLRQRPAEAFPSLLKRGRCQRAAGARSSRFQEDKGVPKNCLNEQTLTNYLEDSLQATARATAEEHLISCDTCRSRLVYYMRILDEDVREEEEPVVAEAMQRWDSERVPVSVPAKGFGRRSILFRAGLAATVLAAVALGGILGFLNPRSIPGEEYVQTRLRERRPFQSRTSLQVAGDTYVAYVETRDGGAPGADMSSTAEVLTRGAEQGGAGNHLLGLGYLVDEDWDRAVSYLEAAAEEFPDDPEIQNDLGVAYLERDKPNADAESDDHGRSTSHFLSAIGFDDDYLPARFNLVLLYRTMGMEAEIVAQAADRYFEADPDSGWAAELRELVGSGGRGTN